MKKEDLMKGINGIDDEFIEEYAVMSEKKPKKETIKLWQIATFAACVAAVIITVMFSMPGMVVKAVERTPEPTRTPRPSATPEPKVITTPWPVVSDVMTDYAEEGVRYYKQDKDNAAFYGKVGYEKYIELNDVPRNATDNFGNILYTYPSRLRSEMIHPYAFDDLEKLRECYITPTVAHYEYQCEDGTRFRIQIRYLAYDKLGLEDDSNTVDCYNQIFKRIADGIKEGYDFEIRLPEVKKFDPSLYSEDLNRCKKFDSVDFETADGRLVYSYVEGRLVCIYFYSYDVEIEIYSEDIQDWVQSLDGWMADLGSIETAPKAADKLTQIAEESWEKRFEWMKEYYETHGTTSDRWYGMETEEWKIK